MTEKRPKPGTIADREALVASDQAQSAVRAWWRRVPLVLTHPAAVFAALRDDDDVDLQARSEPILAIVILAGMAGIILTPTWGTQFDDATVDWLVLAVVTFIGGIFYGAAGYFLLGLAVWLGARGVGGDAPARRARHVLAFACVPLALSIVVTLPLALVAFGADFFRSGGERRRDGPRDRALDRARLHRLELVPAGRRPAHHLPPHMAGRGRHRGACERPCGRLCGASQRALSRPPGEPRTGVSIPPTSDADPPDGGASANAVASNVRALWSAPAGR